MNRTLIIAASLALFGSLGCGPPLNTKNPVQCEAIATCGPDEVEVANCEGLDNCRVTEVCGTSAACLSTPQAKDFDQSCEVDADCTLVDLAGPCCTQCADGPINVAATNDVEAYFESVSCELSVCTDSECDTPLVAVCDNGTCAARSEPAGIVAGDYDQSCAGPSDCTLINEGDPCECHVCPDASINADAIDAYNQDVVDAMCGDVACPAIGCGEEILAVCSSAGTCKAQQAVYVEADEFDRSCETATDCMAVYAGEACSECQCPNAAISVDAADEYSAAFAEADCQTQPCPCAGAAADCVNNTCVVVQ